MSRGKKTECFPSTIVRLSVALVSRGKSSLHLCSSQLSIWCVPIKVVLMWSILALHVAKLDQYSFEKAESSNRIHDIDGSLVEAIKLRSLMNFLKP